MITFNVTEARRQLLRLIKSAQEEGQCYSITVNGKPAVVMISTADYEQLLETLDVLSDRLALEDIAVSEAQKNEGDLVDLEAL